MIKTIRLKNFQSHKDTKIEFHEGVNVITGTSDSGKTAILRGLIWLATNKPGGDSFRSDWGGETAVTVALDNGVVISRVKGTQNKYELNDMEFLAFGAKVPEEIQEALNLSEINIQEQLEKPFLLDETPGKVASHFNQIANLEKIDQSQSHIKSVTLKISQSLSSKKELKKELKETLISFDYLEKREIELEVLEEQEKGFLVQIKRFSKLTQVLLGISEIEKKLKSKRKITILEKDLNVLFEKQEKVTWLELNISSLLSIVKELETNQKEALQLDKLVRLEKPVLKTLTLIEDRAVSIEKYQLLEGRVTSIIENKENSLKQLKTLNKLELEFKENFPDVCPLCETVVNKEV